MKPVYKRERQEKWSFQADGLYVQVRLVHVIMKKIMGCEIFKNWSDHCSWKVVYWELNAQYTRLSGKYWWLVCVYDIRSTWYVHAVSDKMYSRIWDPSQFFCFCSIPIMWRQTLTSAQRELTLAYRMRSVSTHAVDTSVKASPAQSTTKSEQGNKLVNHFDIPMRYRVWQ